MPEPAVARTVAKRPVVSDEHTVTARRVEERHITFENLAAIPASIDCGRVEDQCNFTALLTWNECRAKRLVTDALGGENLLNFAPHRLNFAQHG